ncbi:MAG: J domain-containing protein [Sandaracinaceae bacterium]|nr:J domain-containing protein [Sandaracinaceae bacterium]
MTDRLELLDYYTLLGVEPDASVPEIKEAFRRFARRYHPDRFAGDDERLARSTQIYRRGSEAYQILTSSVSRRAYDRLLRMGKVRLGADERERAELEERRAQAPGAAPIRSAQARGLYERAAEAARAGAWRDAWRLMKSALELEPDNELLKARLNQIESRARTVR